MFSYTPPSIVNITAPPLRGGTMEILGKDFVEQGIAVDIYEDSCVRPCSNIQFISHKEFEDSIGKFNTNRKVLLTVDDGFSSFYENAWPILKEEKIPFVIFINTETIGSRGYMDWNEIKEIAKFDFVHIGNHSHSHDYLVDKTDEEIKQDLLTAKKIWKTKLNYETKFFAYPFGEYKNSYKKIVEDLGFIYGFGQHSGVIDINKNPYELPRFPINEKYGDLERFEFIIDLLPLEYKNVIPKDKYITNNNPPKLEITFFEDQKNLENINCFSDEGNNWKQSKIKFQDNKLFVDFSDKFLFRRGRINCSLNDKEGWRWFGLQFSVKLN